MSNFNYEKSYCVQALPAFNNLPYEVLNVHSKLIPLVGELTQNKQLLIPISPAIEELIESLTTEQIANLSRCSYFVGHWQPSVLEKPFENKKGESWKISNCCDQVLRKILSPPHNIQIHEGKLRVTFSNKDCWLCEEFALATEDNLQIFKKCKLPFDESTLHDSANTLKNKIGDLWPDIETEVDNDLYRKLFELKVVKIRERVIQNCKDKIENAKQKQIDAQVEAEALSWLVDHNYYDLDNVIYYSHTKRFCFGWRTPLTDKKKSYLQELLTEFLFDYDLK